MSPQFPLCNSTFSQFGQGPRKTLPLLPSLKIILQNCNPEATVLKSLNESIALVNWLRFELPLVGYGGHRERRGMSLLEYLPPADDSVLSTFTIYQQLELPETRS